MADLLTLLVNSLTWAMATFLVAAGLTLVFGTLHILNFSVGNEYRRMGVGTQMVLRLVDKLSQQRRQEIVLEVRERNLDAQLFFKSHAFKAITVLRHHYEDTEEDAYIMRFRLDATADVLSPFAPVNRISEFDAA